MTILSSSFCQFLFIDKAIGNTNNRSDMLILLPAHNTGAVGVPDVSFGNHQLFFLQLQQNTNMVVLSVDKHPVIQQDVPFLPDKICITDCLLSVIVCNPFVSLRKLFPSAAPCQTTAAALLRTVRDGKSRLNTAVIDKRCASHPLCLFQIPFGKQPDDGKQVGRLVFCSSVKGSFCQHLRSLRQLFSSAHPFPSFCLFYLYSSIFSNIKLSRGQLLKNLVKSTCNCYNKVYSLLFFAKQKHLLHKFTTAKEW